MRETGLVRAARLQEGEISLPLDDPPKAQGEGRDRQTGGKKSEGRKHTYAF